MSESVDVSERQLFPARPTAGSPGRFRPTEEPIGVSIGGGRAHPVRLAAGPIAWLRLMPKFNPGRTWSLAELAEAVTQSGGGFAPFGIGPGSYSVGLLAGTDGFGTWVTQGREQTPWTSFVFTTGEVWGADAITMNTQRELIHYDPAAMAAALNGYRELLIRLGTGGPWNWIAGMEGTSDRSLAPPTATLHQPEGYTQNEVITAHGDLEAGQDAADAARAYFFTIRVACGLGLSG